MNTSPRLITVVQVGRFEFIDSGAKRREAVLCGSDLVKAYKRNVLRWHSAKAVCWVQHRQRLYLGNRQVVARPEKRTPRQKQTLLGYGSRPFPNCTCVLFDFGNNDIAKANGALSGNVHAKFFDKRSLQVAGLNFNQNDTRLFQHICRSVFDVEVTGLKVVMIKMRYALYINLDLEVLCNFINSDEFKRRVLDAKFPGREFKITAMYGQSKYNGTKIRVIEASAGSSTAVNAFSTGIVMISSNLQSAIVDAHAMILWSLIFCPEAAPED